MKILHINYSDIKGGAAIAMYRLHQELNKTKSIKSNILVVDKNLKKKNVYSFSGDNLISTNKFKRKISFQLTKFQKIKSKITHSLNIFDSSILKNIKEINPDIIHLHWINNEMLSIRQISQISKMGFPIVWTMHDMWPYCGAEHYTSDKRFISGYTSLNKPKKNFGIDLNRYIWQLKKLLWKDVKFNLISPSRWQFNNVSKSNLFKDQRNCYIPLGINLDELNIINKIEAKKKLKLKTDYNYILFGSAESPDNNRKGFDLLCKLLNNNFFTKRKIAIMIFGNKKGYSSCKINIPLFYLGKLKENDFNKMGLIYSACDLTIVPSRIESFGLVALESLAHKRPVITFDKIGTADLIIQKKNGFKSKYLDIKSLLAGIKWYYNLSAKQIRKVNNFSQKVVKENFNIKKIARIYIEKFKIINANKFEK